MTVTQLSSFLAVARTGSVSAAADALVVTQPSVSAAVAALARELGADLLERAGRSIRLTAAGVAFEPYASDVLGLLEQGRTAAREAAEGASRSLRIAAVTTAAESFVPPLMRAFRTAHPDVELSLDVGNRARVLDLVLDHQADLAVTGHPPTDARLYAVGLMPNEFVLVTAPDDPLAGGETAPLAALGDRTWLLREPGSGTRALSERFLAAADLHPSTLTLGSNGAIEQAARAGLGVSLVSRVAVEDDLRARRLASVPLASPPTPSRWYLLRSAIGPVRAPVAAFMEFAPSAAVLVR